ncbi:MAG: ATP-dependent RecD-like DNA helicase [Proteobacteria bacterium]|nr:ATP-dependent RecD-like DNA helicase [Pseudomonadota bacterium]MCP4921884.1 ATP-dependent RecD-like DNA helicase [Pseudomonadota bacterium]
MYSDTLEGELRRVDYATDDGAFAVVRIRAESGEVVAVGPIGHLPPGSHVRLDGSWSTHPKYGRRFRVKQYLVEDPRTLDGLRRYLASGAVRGLGAELARRAVDRFGLEVLDILDDEPERLLEVPGIGKKRLDDIIGCWERDKSGRELTVMLRGHGLGAAVTQRILDKYGDGALKVVTSNPYRLADDIQGVAFRTADTIARAVGIASDDPRRADAAIRWLLMEGESDGHCFLPRGELTRRCSDLQIPAARVEGSLKRLVLEGRLVVRDTTDPVASPVYRAEVERRERDVADRLKALFTDRREVSHSVELAQTRVGLTLNPDQAGAVGLALASGVSVITGGPGTGKTTIVKVLMEAADLQKEDWALAAPTGRAARRLAESCGKEGKTIHRLLEYSMQTGGFTRDASKPLEIDGLVVDEASMLDLGLMDAVLAALPSGARLVLVGDADQLPSVGAGNVLADLISSGQVPVASLTQVYRQAEDSAIVQNAWRILRGLPVVSAEKSSQAAKKDFFLVAREDAIRARQTLCQVVQERLPAKGFDPLVDVQVLTPMRKGPLGTFALNEALQDLLNPDGKELVRGQRRYREGDRVLQVKNDYDTDVFNGDVGRITALDESSMTVDFDGRVVTLVGEQLDLIELAYAISIHKSQGSEYRAVVVVLHTGHHVMLRRSLLYTAVTRAKEFCAIVGSRRAVGTAIRSRGNEARWTGLADRLR